MGGLSLWHWLVVLVIVVVIFGTKRLKNVGEDLGDAVRGFKKGLHGDEQPPRQDATSLPETPSLPRDAAATPTEGMRPEDDDRR